MKLMRRAERQLMSRRQFFTRALAGASALMLAGCNKLSETEWFPKLLGSAEGLNNSAQHLFTSRKSMAQEFTEADLSPSFRSNGTSEPDSDEYATLADKDFADWALKVDGLVEKSMQFTLAELRAMPSRTQITRHDCVEGWSAIGKWTGVPLHQILEQVNPQTKAKYVVFYCADPMEEDGTKPYYESIDMEDAYHPQTILAYELNGEVLPIANGAPIRLRVERQLGYKQAKYIMRIALVESFKDIAGGKGGYWEDEGYTWYAGI
jgi:DMSO/TMAO reductase YedYZ molybdopterin-dependent catalytic subunit